MNKDIKNLTAEYSKLTKKENEIKSKKEALATKTVTGESMRFKPNQYK